MPELVVERVGALAVAEECSVISEQQLSQPGPLEDDADCLADLGALTLAEEELAAVSAAPPPAAAEADESQDAAVSLTPEQEAAVAAAADAFVSLYEQAYLSRAVQQLAETCQQQGVPESAVAAQLRGRGIQLAQLQERAAELELGIAQCSSDDGWRLIQDDGQLRLLYRHEPGSTVHCFKGSCTLPAPLEQPLAMAREFDLVKTWNSYITNSNILRTYCDVDLLVYTSIWLPWPFAERDLLISAVADDQLGQRGVVAVSFASPHDTPPGVGPDLPPGADQRVRMFFSSGSCMTMTPLPPAPATVTLQAGGAGVAAVEEQQQTRVVVVCNIDSRVGHVPEALIQFVLRVFAPFMYSTVLKVLVTSFQDPGAPLPQRMQQNQQLYDMMRQRCKDYLEGQQTDGQQTDGQQTAAST